MSHGLGFITRLRGDRSVDRGNERINVRYGIGLGGSMATGGTIGMATATAAGFYVLPLSACAYVAAH